MSFECLAGNEQETRFFLRDDDIDVVEDTLVTLLDICRGHRVPISLAVIPAKLTGDCATLLRARSNEVELHQHGWSHINHEPEGKKCEFGASRTFDQQRRDIAAGRARMDEAFGSKWFPAFTPPWNRCNADSLRVLDELGFAVLSADGDKVNAPVRLRQIPITLDIFRWKGNTTLRPREELIIELSKQIERRQTIGILLHHKVMDRAAFDFLDWLLGAIVRYPRAPFETLETLSGAPRIRGGTYAG